MKAFIETVFFLGLAYFFFSDNAESLVVFLLMVIMTKLIEINDKLIK